ncbi:unnamed protein product [Ectocarpus sp. 4 AP-2014]
MAASIQELQGKLVSVITGDGRQILGNLKGYDHTINLVLEGCKERIYSQSRGVEQARKTGTCSSMVQLGLYICRGDNIAVIGEVDEVEDASKDLSRIRAEPLKPVTH